MVDQADRSGLITGWPRPAESGIVLAAINTKPLRGRLQPVLPALNPIEGLPLRAAPDLRCKSGRRNALPAKQRN